MDISLFELCNKIEGSTKQPTQQKIKYPIKTSFSNNNTYSIIVVLLIYIYVLL